MTLIHCYSLIDWCSVSNSVCLFKKKTQVFIQGKRGQFPSAQFDIVGKKDDAISLSFSTWK